MLEIRSIELPVIDLSVIKVNITQTVMRLDTTRLPIVLQDAPDYGIKMYQCQIKPGQCGCPCVEEAEYDHCKNQFLLGM